MEQAMKYRVVCHARNRWDLNTGEPALDGVGGEYESPEEALTEVVARELYDGGSWEVEGREGPVVLGGTFGLLDPNWEAVIDFIANDLGAGTWEAVHLVEGLYGFQSGDYLRVERRGVWLVAVDVFGLGPQQGDEVARGRDEDELLQALVALDVREDYASRVIREYVEEDGED